MKIETRDNKLYLSGYVNAVERDSKEIMTKRGRCVEQIAAGAFAKSLADGHEVRMMYNHSRDIGSTTDGTLALKEDNIGLYATVETRDEELMALAGKGLLKGWSFGFNATDDELEERSEGKTPRRRVKSLDLVEVSILSVPPAYNGTSVECRQEGCEIRANMPGLLTLCRQALLRAFLVEKRYNPYHNPKNGRFTSAAGGTNVMGYSGAGGLLVVERGQKGKGYLVGISKQDEQEDALSGEYEEWAKNRQPAAPTPAEKAQEIAQQLEDGRHGSAQRIIDKCEAKAVERKEVEALKEPLTEDQIIERLGGGDETKGSCTSLAYAYAANKAGYDVIDFRGEPSTSAFATGAMYEISKLPDTETRYYNKQCRSQMMKELKSRPEGEEYIMMTGEHAAVVRREGKKILYLELQHEPGTHYKTPDGNGFRELSCKVLGDRFKADASKDFMTLTKIEDVIKAEGFCDMMSYINTDAGKQQKGAHGGEK